MDHDLFRFEYDHNKNAKNIARHKISFELAKLVFRDPNVHDISDDIHSNEESRLKAIGIVGNQHISVIYTSRTQDEDDFEWYRLISARQSTADEIKQYRDQFLLKSARQR